MQTSRLGLLFIFAALLLNCIADEKARLAENDRASQPPSTPPSGITPAVQNERRPNEEAEARHKARLHEKQEGFVAKSAITRMTTYEPVLSELGLSPDQISGVSDQLASLHREAKTAGAAMMRLAEKRAHFDRDMKDLLGDEGYLKYRAFEDAKPFRREVEHLKELAAKKKIEIAPPVEKELVRLLQQLDLQTMESWDGPYDPFPAPRVGEAQILPKRHSQLRHVSERFLALQQNDEWRALPFLVREAGIEYFAQKIQEIQTSIHLLNLPREAQLERIRAITERLTDRIRPKPPQSNSPPPND